MSIPNIKWLSRLLLTSIYVLGVLGVVGSGGGGGSDSCDITAASCIQPSPPTSLGPVGFNSTVNTIGPASDSSDDVYVGGLFTVYKNSIVNRIARLNNDGSLDTGFATGSGFNGSVSTIAPANDGSGDVYVGGGFASYDGTPVGDIVRLNLDGTRDAGFDNGSGFNGAVKIIAPAIDGSGDIYVSGFFTSYDGVVVGSGLIRLNDDGSLDAGFSTGSGWGEEGIALATDGSGDVYVAKSTSPGIARLNDDGSIDTGFDTGLSGFNGDVRAIAVATDGSSDIYAAGFFTDYNGTGTNGLARLDSDGSLDSGFVTEAGYVGWGNFITPAIDSSGDIYVDRNYVGKIVRLNNDGPIDTGFDINLGFNADPNSVALATDGSGDIYVGGSFTQYNLSTVGRMVRLTAGGALVK
jgi:uncharacterized delta-60 repeat protein